MKTETAHTPTPWYLVRVLERSAESSGVLNIRSGDENILAITDRNKRDEVNAQRIVRAVNAHDALVDALKANIAQWESWKATEGTDEEEPACITQARAALAKAKGGAL